MVAYSWSTSGAKRVAQTIDWNTADNDWQGRGWDRGLRVSSSTMKLSYDIRNAIHGLEVWPYGNF